MMQAKGVLSRIFIGRETREWNTWSEVLKKFDVKATLNSLVNVNVYKLDGKF